MRSNGRKRQEGVGVDLDPQSSLTVSLGFRGTYGSTVNDLFLRRIEHKEPGIIEPLRHGEGMAILPSCGDLAHTASQIGSVIGREVILKKYLDTLRDEYDYIMIDCPPALNHLTVNAMTAADEILIPVEADYLSVQGMQRLFGTFQEIREHMNTNLKIGGILLTMHDPRSHFAREMANRLWMEYGNAIPVLNPAIPKSIKAVEASAQGQSILAYAPSNPVAKAYREVAEGLLRRERLRYRQRWGMER